MQNYKWSTNLSITNDLARKKRLSNQNAIILPSQHKEQLWEDS